MRSMAMAWLLVIALFAAAGCDTGTSSEPKLPWHDALEAALEEANERGTLIVVDVYADWCGPCAQLERNTIADPKVQEKLEAFTRLKLDGEKYREIAQGYRVQGYPTVLALDKNGKLLQRKAGYMDVEKFLEFLNSVKAE